MISVLAAPAVMTATASDRASRLPGPGLAPNSPPPVELDAAACVALGPRTPFPNGQVTPISDVIGDVNRDGRPDIVTANVNGPSVSVLLGNGSGSFGPPTDFATAGRPYCVDIGDLNCDGNPDLAVAGELFPGYASVLLGNGDGTFQPRVDYPTGGNTHWIDIGDLNNDGLNDLVAGRYYDSTVSVLLNTGGGVFGAPIDTPVGSGGAPLALADLDDDCNLDVVTSNGSAGTVSVLLGNGDGTFVRTDFPCGPNPYTVAIADFDRDGALDLATINYFASAVALLRGLGGGTFAAPVTFPTAAGPGMLVTGDMNCDGAMDLAVASQTGNAVSVLLGNGSGSFGPHTDFPCGDYPVALNIGDVNRDGRPDIVTSDHLDNTVSVLLNPPTLAMPTCMVPPSGMTAWWPLDEMANGSVIDLVGPSLGAHYGSPGHIAGQVAGALRLSAGNQHVRVPDGPPLNFGTGSFSIDAWVRSPDASTPVRTIVDKRSSSSPAGYSLYISYGHLGLQMADASGYTNHTSLSPTLTDGAWHHVAASVDRAGLGRLYVDGVLVLAFDPSDRPGSVTNPGSLLIGQSYNFSSASFNGDIDEVELFDRPLDAAEVCELYNAGPAGKCRPIAAAPDPATGAPPRFLRVSNNPLIRGALQFHFTLSTPEEVDLHIFSVSGRLERSVALGRMATGPQSPTWDGTLDDGRVIAPGIYYARIILKESGRAFSHRIAVLK